MDLRATHILVRTEDMENWEPESIDDGEVCMAAEQPERIAAIFVELLGAVVLNCTKHIFQPIHYLPYRLEGAWGPSP